MNHEELKEVLRLHEMWLRGENGGVRANLAGADLTGVCLAGADLTGVYLAGADLTGAYLTRANLAGACLTEAHLTGACLTGAYLTRADLRWSVGNMTQIKSMQIEQWAVAYTHDIMAIGCKQHLILDWWKFTDEEISLMDQSALDWWKKWKPVLRQIIEMSPAVGPEAGN